MSSRRGSALKSSLTALLLCLVAGCATIVNDPSVPVSFTMSDGSNAECSFTNKRGRWVGDIPATLMIRRSDDALRYDCDTEDGRRAVGALGSEIESEKMAASVVFLDLGITDAITDMHRKYPSSFVIPVRK